MSRSGTRLWSFRPTVGAVVVGVGGTGVAADPPAPPKPAGERVEPFRIAVPDPVLHDLKDRLARTRWPDQIDGSGWEYGVPVATMKELVASWIVDKFWAWSDHGGKLDNSFTQDELLTNVMIYWVTESMPSSVRIYYESSHNLPRPASMTPFQTSGKPAPVGYALFPKEINVPPRAWVERASGGKLFHWTEMPRGGHFAALEQPGLLVDDVRAFFRKVR